MLKGFVLISLANILFISFFSYGKDLRGAHQRASSSLGNALGTFSRLDSLPMLLVLGMFVLLR